ncbi:hypothetical protein FQN55_003724 [Onygenales sp. PD_40]|nr:hypothetical protein FQN55_003724 [Onygenales sp. PD_40]KAK2783707.1 hypothetical protein FQN53_009029 [Emmonsiellopsis sp. PD_33]KAK2785611.1 hypothetical protein FQN51_003790 [Onygenales sp. PD_10]KAK2792164.1 hypothetical protein FQN52_003932 [Onygenales sp. PD_12]
MGHDEFVDLKISNAMAVPLAIENAELDHGKFYVNEDMDMELAPEEITETVIPTRASANICSCGEKDSLLGTEGSLDLVDQSSGAQICTLNWGCHSYDEEEDNMLSLTNRNSDYLVRLPQNISRKGSLGTLDIRIGKMS